MVDGCAFKCNSIRFLIIYYLFGKLHDKQAIDCVFLIDIDQKCCVDLYLKEFFRSIRRIPVEHFIQYPSNILLRQFFTNKIKIKMFGLKLLICVFLLTKPVLSKNSSVCSVQKLKNIENNVSTSILYGILRASIEYSRTGECNRELIRMLDGIHNSELWAIKGFFYFSFGMVFIRNSITPFDLIF